MLEEPTIYVVDDDDKCRESMCALVTAKGFIAEGFRSGEEFLGRTNAPSETGCLITDYKMGGMTGLELQEELASQNCHLPVIVVSGHANVSVAVRAMVNGAVTLLEKPHSEEQLMGAIDKAVHRSAKIREREQRRQKAREAWESLNSELREVARLLVAGYANKVVASKLDLSLRTVERRRRELLDQVGVKTVPQLARLVAVLEEDDGTIE